MRQTVEDQVEHVLIGQVIEDVFSFAATSYDVVTPKHPQPLRDNRNRFTFEFREFGHTRFALCQACDQANSCRFS